MRENNKNRKGYKKSKVGWIPVDWACVKLGQLFSKRNVRGKSGTPVFSITQDKGLIPRDSLNRRVGISLLPEQSLLVEPGDVAYNMMRMWQGAVDVSREECVVSPAYVVCRPSVAKIDSWFMFFFFKSRIGLNKLRSYSYGVANDRLRLYFNDFRLVPAPLPSLPEQKAIASVLECWDKAIQKYEEKIEKKKNIKIGLMQKLLSGEQRLPGFDGEWESIQFDSVFSFLKSYAFSRSELTSKEYPGCICNVHYGDIHAKYIGSFLDCSIESLIPVIRDPSNSPINYQYLQDGDLVIADASEDFKGIGACIELQNVGTKTIIGGLHTFVARDTSGKTAEIYRGYLFKEHSISRELKRISTGASVIGISKRNLSKVLLLLPPLPEQKAIASILSSTDSEIKALEKKLALLRDQKKYLLNNLVAGTIRLPEFCKEVG